MRMAGVYEEKEESVASAANVVTVGEDDVDEDILKLHNYVQMETYNGAKIVIYLQVTR